MTHPSERPWKGTHSKTVEADEEREAAIQHMVRMKDRLRLATDPYHVGAFETLERLIHVLRFGIHMDEAAEHKGPAGE